jgi:hypothetical protein
MIVPRATARGRVGYVARRIVSLVTMLSAFAGFTAASSDSRILFAAGTAVPRPVQEFAWQIIETRCNYQSFEREQRSFFAYDARAMRTAAGVAYSISIRSDLTWQRSEPPAFIEMTVVDEGGLRLTALRSSFVVCTDPRATGALPTP